MRACLTRAGLLSIGSDVVDAAYPMTSYISVASMLHSVPGTFLLDQRRIDLLEHKEEDCMSYQTHPNPFSLSLAHYAKSSPNQKPEMMKCMIGGRVSMGVVVGDDFESLTMSTS